MIDMKHWQEDPRLKQMDPKKLQYITDFAGRLTSMSKNQLIPALLQLQADAARNHIRFSDSETELLVSILSADMNPAEKKKLETLRFFAKKLAARSSGQPVFFSCLSSCFIKKLFTPSVLPESEA